MSANLKAALKATLKSAWQSPMFNYRKLWFEINALKDMNKSIFAAVFFGANASATAFLLLKDTYYLDTYMNNVWKRHQFGFPMELNKKLVTLSNQVLNELQINTRTTKIDFFTCTGYEPRTLGIARNLRVGLPFYFDYNSVKNIDKHEIGLFGHSPNWKSLDGKEFLKNLVLTEKAKKYAIAEQIRLATSWTNNWVFDLGPLFAGFYASGIYLRQEWYYKTTRKDLSSGIRFCRAFGWAMLLYSVAFLLFYRLEDTFGNREVDKFLEELKGNQDYIDGGIEYYIKQQKRNKIQRTWFGEDGSFFFKANGDVRKWLCAKYSVSEMIEKLSQIDRLSSSGGLNKISEEDVKATL